MQVSKSGLLGMSGVDMPGVKPLNPKAICLLSAAEADTVMVSAARPGPSRKSPVVHSPCMQ